MIRPAHIQDASVILEIYQHYVLNTHSTFEIVPPSLQLMESKIRESSYPWLVTELEGEIVGYAYATQWKPRHAYTHTVETSIYLHHQKVGKGFGTPLYRLLLDDLKDKGYHAALAGIALPNKTSIQLHEKLGFQKVGQLKEVGYKFDRWIDVGYWELMF